MYRQNILQAICFLMIFSLPFQLLAQLPDSTQQKIDRIFDRFTPRTPGCAVSVSRNGELIFQKGYGMANLEYNIPITPKTIFHIASVSKQVTAFCILLLEKEGKLSLDDDIRKYLDYVPDFGEKITIRQMINHTSGLRDQWQLLANAGFQLDDVITQEHIVKLVGKQTALNFKPGEEYMYSNTGYTLQAEIVKKVSGLTLRQYADKNIFKPLGMTDTHFHDDYEELVPGRAQSYEVKPNGSFAISVLSYSNVGATSLFTTVVDEAKWLDNFSSGKVGGKDLIEKMSVHGILNDGRKIPYATGVVVEEYKGHKIIDHSGGDASFSTYVMIFPELNLNITVFSNHGNGYPWAAANKIADILLPAEKKKTVVDKKLAKTDSIFQKKLQGKYYSDRGDLLTLSWQKGKLVRIGGPANLPVLELEKLAENRYTTDKGGPVLIYDTKKNGGDSATTFQVEYPTSVLSFSRMPGKLNVVPADYTGLYFNRETEAFYRVIEKDGKLFMEHRKYPTTPLNSFAPDQFKLDYWWMSNIVFKRDPQGKVYGFEVNSGRVLHLKFEKVEGVK